MSRTMDQTVGAGAAALKDGLRGDVGGGRPARGFSSRVF
jgi:hypothetical protein